MGIGEDLAAISRGVPSNDLSSEMVCYFLCFTWSLGSNWEPLGKLKRGVCCPQEQCLRSLGFPRTHPGLDTSQIPGSVQAGLS